MLGYLSDDRVDTGISIALSSSHPTTLSEVAKANLEECSAAAFAALEEAHEELGTSDAQRALERAKLRAFVTEDSSCAYRAASRRIDECWPQGSKSADLTRSLPAPSKVRDDRRPTCGDGRADPADHSAVHRVASARPSSTKASEPRSSSTAARRYYETGLSSRSLEPLTCKQGPGSPRQRIAWVRIDNY